MGQASQELRPLKIGNSENDLKACLRLQMLKVGIRAQNMPHDEEKAVLIAFVRKYWGNLTPEMVSEAFDLAITDKLELNSNQVNCYENFSCEFVGRILAAYRKYLIFSGRLKSCLDKERQFIPPENQKLLALPPMAPQEKIDISYAAWKPYKNWKYILAECYPTLCANGQIVLSKVQQEAFMALAALHIQHDLATDPNYFNNRNRKEFQKVYARKLAIAKYFETLLI